MVYLDWAAELQFFSSGSSATTSRNELKLLKHQKKTRNISEIRITNMKRYVMFASQVQVLLIVVIYFKIILTNNLFFFFITSQKAWGNLLWKSPL